MSTEEKTKRACDIAHRAHHRERAVAEAEALVAEHGVLPNPSYLREHGHCNLAATLWKYPEWFAHLAQETALKRHRKERVAEAEALVAKEGLLSYVHDLRKRGHAQLATALECHPEWFAHLPQETALEATERSELRRLRPS